MNLESIGKIYNAPSVIGEKQALTTSRGDTRKARRVVILDLIAKNSNISKVALTKMCRDKGLGEYSTIIRDLTYFIKNNIVKVIITPVKTHNLVIA